MADTDYNNEIWRDIPGWEGFYQVSNAGRVKSVARQVLRTKGRGAGSMWFCRERVLSQAVNPVNGYRFVQLARDGQTKMQYIHRIVCSTFHGAASSAEMQAAHYDGDKLNNTPANLRWATPLENVADRYRHGTVPFGKDHANWKHGKYEGRSQRKTSASLP